ncbi:MAG: leucine-rich repeat domain-containing protein [Treponema sp.]|nr:leucine-rich repeat domain-containing protein [Treponema sp.]
MKNPANQKIVLIIQKVIILVITLLLASCDNPFLSEVLEPLFPEECTVCVENNFAATCVEQGTVGRTCAKHKLHNNAIFTDALGHNWDEWEILNYPTIFAEGMEIRKCVRNNCDEFQQRTLYASGTPGLEFTLINGGTAYSVSIGTAEAADIEIPGMHNEKPVTEIASYGFSASAITSITIPASIINIHGTAFFQSYNLTSIIIDSNNEHYSFDFDDEILYKAKTQLIWVSYAKTAYFSFTIPDFVTSIGDYAFLYRSNLMEINLPAGLISIGDYAFYGCAQLFNILIPASVTHIGNNAFLNNSQLKNIDVDRNNPNYYSSPDGVLYNKDQTILIQAPGGLFGQYEIPSSVIKINSGAFWNVQINRVSIPGGISEDNFEENSFNGNLRDLYFSANGGAGTYMKGGGTGGPGEDDDNWWKL